MKPRITCAALVVTGLLGGGRSVVAADLEGALEGKLRGAWAVITVEVYSGCSGTYTNNHVSGGGVASRGDRRFEPGELAKVDKLSVKRSGVDLFLTLAEPVLVAHLEGPFELFDERECKVQLMLELDRQVVATDDVAAALTEIQAVLQTQPSLEAARRSALWNGRRREPYPDDYQLTLARHSVWKAEQVNAAVGARSDQALAEAVRGPERVRRDPSYLDGFAAGLEAMHSWWSTDCDRLVTASFAAEEHDPPREHASDRPWCQGFRDGQELAFNLLLLDRLRGCYVPVPPLPAGAGP